MEARIIKELDSNVLTVRCSAIDELDDLRDRNELSVELAVKTFELLIRRINDAHLKIKISALKILLYILYVHIDYVQNPCLALPKLISLMNNSRENIRILACNCVTLICRRLPVSEWSKYVLEALMKSTFSEQKAYFLKLLQEFPGIIPIADLTELLLDYNIEIAKLAQEHLVGYNAEEIRLAVGAVIHSNKIADKNRYIIFNMSKPIYEWALQQPEKGVKYYDKTTFPKFIRDIITNKLEKSPPRLPLYVIPLDKKDFEKKQQVDPLPHPRSPPAPYKVKQGSYLSYFPEFDKRKKGQTRQTEKLMTLELGRMTKKRLLEINVRNPDLMTSPLKSRRDRQIKGGGKSTDSSFRNPSIDTLCNLRGESFVSNVLTNSKSKHSVETLDQEVEYEYLYEEDYDQDVEITPEKKNLESNDQEQNILTKDMHPSQDGEHSLNQEASLQQCQGQLTQNDVSKMSNESTGKQLNRGLEQRCPSATPAQDPQVCVRTDEINQVNATLELKGMSMMQYALGSFNRDKTGHDSTNVVVQSDMNHMNSLKDDVTAQVNGTVDNLSSKQNGMNDITQTCDSKFAGSTNNCSVVNGQLSKDSAQAVSSNSLPKTVEALTGNGLDGVNAINSNKMNIMNSSDSSLKISSGVSTSGTSTTLSDTTTGETADTTDSSGALDQQTHQHDILHTQSQNRQTEPIQHSSKQVDLGNSTNENGNMVEGKQNESLSGTTSSLIYEVNSYTAPSFSYGVSCSVQNQNDQVPRSETSIISRPLRSEEYTENMVADSTAVNIGSVSIDSAKSQTAIYNRFNGNYSNTKSTTRNEKKESGYTRACNKFHSTETDISRNDQRNLQNNSSKDPAFVSEVNCDDTHDFIRIEDKVEGQKKNGIVKRKIRRRVGSNTLQSNKNSFYTGKTESHNNGVVTDSQLLSSDKDYNISHNPTNLSTDSDKGPGSKLKLAKKSNTLPIKGPKGGDANIIKAEQRKNKSSLQPKNEFFSSLERLHSKNGIDTKNGTSAVRDDVSCRLDDEIDYSKINSPESELSAISYSTYKTYSESSDIIEIGEGDLAMTIRRHQNKQRKRVHITRDMIRERRRQEEDSSFLPSEKINELSSLNKSEVSDFKSLQPQYLKIVDLQLRDVSGETWFGRFTYLQVLGISIESGSVVPNPEVVQNVLKAIYPLHEKVNLLAADVLVLIISSAPECVTEYLDDILRFAMKTASVSLADCLVNDVDHSELLTLIKAYYSQNSVIVSEYNYAFGLVMAVITDKSKICSFTGITSALTFACYHTRTEEEFDMLCSSIYKNYKLYFMKFARAQPSETKVRLAKFIDTDKPKQTVHKPINDEDPLKSVYEELRPNAKTDFRRLRFALLKCKFNSSEHRDSIFFKICEKLATSDEDKINIKDLNFIISHLKANLTNYATHPKVNVVGLGKCWLCEPRFFKSSESCLYPLYQRFKQTTNGIERTWICRLFAAIENHTKDSISDIEEVLPAHKRFISATTQRLIVEMRQLL